MMKEFNHIRWEGDRLVLLDQTLLPASIVYEGFDAAEAVCDAIKSMKVRGAPAIGIAAACGLYLGIKDVPDNSNFQDFYRALEEKSRCLAASRPTAVNLFRALERIKGRAAAQRSLPYRN